MTDMTSMYICSFKIYFSLLFLQLVHVHAISQLHNNPPTTDGLYMKAVSCQVLSALLPFYLKNNRNILHYCTAS